MRNNNQSNSIIRWLVVAGDFVLLNVIMLAFAHWHWRMNSWPEGRLEIFVLVNNLALMLGEVRYSTIIHQRIVNAGEILRRVVKLTVLQSVLAYVVLKVFAYDLPVGWLQWGIGSSFVALLVPKRLLERWVVKLYREAGRNTRTAVLVGSDPELVRIYRKLKDDATLGYRVLGYYADSELGQWTHTLQGDGGRPEDAGPDRAVTGIAPSEIKRLGTMAEFLSYLSEPERLTLGDELYLCVSRRDRDIIRRVSSLCDHRLIRFYYVPVSVESIGLNLKSELIDEMEVYTTYENPLQNPLNRLVKRVFDIVLSVAFLIPTAILFPIVWLVIMPTSGEIQSVASDKISHSRVC